MFTVGAVMLSSIVKAVRLWLLSLDSGRSPFFMPVSITAGSCCQHIRT